MKNKKLKEIRNVVFKEEPVELYKILKFENLVESGGDAKVVISEGLVRVNGEVETRKRKKIFSDDVIEYANDIIRIKIAD